MNDIYKTKDEWLKNAKVDKQQYEKKQFLNQEVRLQNGKQATL